MPTKFFFALVAVSLIGLALFIVTWDFAPPSHKVEEIIPNERLRE